MISRPTQIKIVGDQGLGRQFIGPAKSQMAILRNQMRFQKLKQGSRRLWLRPNVHVECLSIYGSEVCIIRAIKKVVKEVIELTKETTILLIVFGDSEQVLNLSNVDGVFEIDEAVSGGSCSGNITSVGGLDGITQTIYGSFTDCASSGVSITGSESDAAGIIDSCKNRYFQKAYQYYEFLESPPALDTLNDEYEIFSALDNSLPAEIDCAENENDLIVTQEWSKILNKFILSTFVYRTKYPAKLHEIAPEDDEFYDEFYYWSAAASYDGQPVTIRGNENYGPFRRTIFAGRGQTDNSYEGQAKLHIGFDLWQDADGIYWISLMSDIEETLYLFKFDQNDNNLILQNTYKSTVRADHYIGKKGYWYHHEWIYNEEDAYKQARLLGYGYRQETDEHVAYWADISHFDQDCHSEYLTYQDTDACFREYYIEILNKEEITEISMDDLIVESTIWNPITREPIILFGYLDYDTTDGTHEDDSWIGIFCALYNSDYGYLGDLIYDGLDDQFGANTIPIRLYDIFSRKCDGYWQLNSNSDLENTLLKYASKTFPHDEGWTSILLKGTDREDNAYENWIIYKDLDGDEGYFALSPDGTKYPIGTYDRAFFYNFTSTDETTNG